jgi:prolyl-tRNA synthetase
MGCYGIGVSRLVAAAIEQNHDANGIIWPFTIAPFHVVLLPINYRDKVIQSASDRLYQQLQKRGVEVLLDDRDERPGVKFKDADLIGIPLRLTVGAKGLEKNTVELRRRRDGKTDEIPLGDAAQATHSIISQSLQA